MVTKQLPHDVERYIREHGLVTKNRVLLVGVSGGIDSVCLLHVLLTLQNRLEIKLHVAHLNHRLRGWESDADAEYVSRLAREFGIEATIDDRDVQEYQSIHRCSLEEAAREVRYSFFAEVAVSIEASAVAVAHTANDQAETIIMHLVRGTGLSGLRGMRPLSRWNLPEGNRLTVVRPLLGTSRNDTEAYCTALELAAREDSSNKSQEFLRNRVRAEVMPRLLEYNPNIIESISRTSRVITDDIAFLDEEVQRVFESVIEVSPAGLAIDNKAFTDLAPAIRRRLLRSGLRNLLGSLRNIELIHIESIDNILLRPAGKKLSLPYGLTFHGDYEKSIITREEDPLILLPLFDDEHILQIPGRTDLPGWKVTAQIIEGKPEIQSGNELVAHFDFHYTDRDLIVRKRKDGDRFQPLGMNESKKLQDFMVDSKIPRAWRDRIPLICMADQIVWVVGWRIGHRARVTESTQKTLRLEFEVE